MNQGTPRKKIYFGWWIVVAGFLVMALSYSPTFSMLGLFIKPLAEEFAVARTVSTVIAVLGSIAGVVAALFAGNFLAKRDIRRIAVLALSLQAANYLLCYSLAPSIVFVMAGAFINGLLNMVITTIPISILINNWFGCKLRGKALSIAMVGSGAGGMVLAPIVGALIENFGWRMGYRFFAILSLCLIPLVLATYVRHPQNKGLAVLGDDVAADGCAPSPDTTGGIPAKKAVRLPIFWLLIIGILLTTGGTQSWNVNNAPYFSDQGFDAIQVSLLMSIAQVGLIINKLLAGAISDRKGPRLAFSICSVCLVGGYALAVFVGKASFLAYPAAILAGAGMASPTMMTSLITRDLFGIRDYAPLIGFAECAMKLGGAVVPLCMSLVYDAMGTYVPALAVVGFLCAVGLALILAAFRIKAPSHAKHWVA
ncbi:MAG: MFS transporter [Oscillospiraceae bacterium]